MRSHEYNTEEYLYCQEEEEQFRKLYELTELAREIVLMKRKEFAEKRSSSVG